MYQRYAVPTGAPDPSGALPARRFFTAYVNSHFSGVTFFSLQSPASYFQRCRRPTFIPVYFRPWYSLNWS